MQMTSSLALGALTGLLACGGGTTTDPDGPGAGLPNFIAKVNGASWQATLGTTVQNPQAGLYSITGFQATGGSQYTIIFQLYHIKGPGTYKLGVGVGVPGGTAIMSLAPSGGWSTPLNGASGELVVTTLTATRMVANFHFTASPQSGSGAPLQVTDGELDLVVQGTGGVALPNQGSIVTGSLGGVPLYASNAASLISGSAPNESFTLTANNGTQSITMTLQGWAGAVTYVSSNNLPIRQIGVSGIDGNLTHTWSTAVGGSVTVNVTTFSSTRIIGSFTGTLSPGPGASGSIAISGNFDLGRP
jgi:hypothetical protein